MKIEVAGVRLLHFDDGTPVRAASAIAPLGEGFVIAQDDATHAGWWKESSIERLRLFEPVEGLDAFSEAEGTKHLKPDLEAACEVVVSGAPGVVLLGSGSSPARMRGALVVISDGEVQVRARDLTPLYEAVAAELGIELAQLNLEGSCRAGSRVRLFNRGNLRAGLDSASVDVGLASLVAAMTGAGDVGAVPVDRPIRYDLGAVDGVGLAVTDAVALPDGRLLLSAAAEDTPNAIDDGPVVAAALALVDGEDVVAVGLLPSDGDQAHKVEGLAVRRADQDGASLVAVVDADDHLTPSAALDLEVRWL